jgi:hypothetical protein
LGHHWDSIARAKPHIEMPVNFSVRVEPAGGVYLANLWEYLV